VNTADQNLNSSCGSRRNTQSGWEITEKCQDVISGAQVSRPGLNRLMDDARARKFEILLVWK
jgi:DNA invertase Pin-like site-specific DNA recombinase